MKYKFPHFLKVTLALLMFSMWIASCSTPANMASGFVVPLDLLAQVEAPTVPNSGIVHGQWIYEELEGLPPSSQQPQFTRTTTDVWIDTESPWRFRFSTTVEPGGLSDDRGWNGEVIWAYDIGSNSANAIMREPTPDEIPSGAMDIRFFVNTADELINLAQKKPARLQDLGSEESEIWGAVRLIAFGWNGTTAPTVQYAGFPHTIIFKVSEADDWLVEWLDIIHTSEGDVVHRHYQLTAWEYLDTAQAPEEIWRFSAPEGVEVVQVAPEPEPTPTIDITVEPTINISSWTVPDYGFIPWLPTFLPAGVALQNVEYLGAEGGYLLDYELNENPLIAIHQGVNVGYRWGNSPETIKFSWGTVEIGPIEPMGPEGWIALIKPEQTGEQPYPNINLLVEIAEREMVMKIIASFQPIR